MRAVITFHSIDEGPGPLSFPPDALRQLLASFRAAAIPVLPLDRLLASADETGVALTFDDGLASVHENAVPILAEFGAVGHVFVVTANVGATNAWPGQPRAAQRYETMGWDQLGSIAENGVSVEAHTHTHPDLRRLSRQAILDEMSEADAQIESRVGRKPGYFAYPYGFHNAEVRDIAGGRYAAALTTELAYLSETDDLAAVPRLDSHYLRSRFLVDHLGAPIGRTYLQFRKALRRVRSMI